MYSYKHSNVHTSIRGGCAQEELAAVNLAKYRKVQTELQDAEERAEVAEQGAAKLRSKSRGASVGLGALGRETSLAPFSVSGGRSISPSLVRNTPHALHESHTCPVHTHTQLLFEYVPR